MGTKVQADAKYHACQEARAKLSGQRSFSQEYSDRQVEVTGGPIGAAAADLLLSPGQASDFGAWLSGLAGQPGVVYHVLEPLHHLLPGGPAEPRRRQLRRELEAYILGHAEAGEGRNCSGRCRRGSAPDPRQPCSCRCRQTQEVDGLCCPRGKGWGLLEVTVTRGRDLWGDYAGSTDAYVRARYRPATGPELVATTAVVPNNNNPEWGVTLRLGEVQLGPEEGEGGPGLTVECWDRDHGYDDDLLGSCQPQPLAAGRHPHVCYFSYGSLSLEVSLSCGPHLGGSRCRQYVPQPPPSGAGGGGGAGPGR
ncbi:perforin-1-like [Chiloscyllium plagiosum]|uniref:perforin-1-like n=1 Tax=Chiloscyllium plagiosum TaxID=36176 RepID=UPI001CB811FF|nr:perforin-1-like [Chiloscyllium plagiosum]